MCIVFRYAKMLFKDEENKARQQFCFPRWECKSIEIKKRKEMRYHQTLTVNIMRRGEWIQKSNNHTPALQDTRQEK